MARVCHLVGPGGLPETGASLFRPFGLRAKGARWQMLLGSHLFEPPTSTMSRPIGRTTTLVDASKPNAANISCQSTPIREQIPKIPSSLGAMSAR